MKVGPKSSLRPFLHLALQMLQFDPEITLVYLAMMFQQTTFIIRSSDYRQKLQVEARKAKIQQIYEFSLSRLT